MLNFAAFLSILLKISIYSLSVSSIDGGTINFSQFQGKKILIVNTARKSKYAKQFASLEQLYQKYKDSLVVVAFPSNDFNHEPGTGKDIKDSILLNYQASYIIGAKQVATGSGMAPIYKWLSESSQNGSIDNPVSADFCKYLIDNTGNIVGVFAGSVDPMDPLIQSAIINH